MSFFKFLRRALSFGTAVADRAPALQVAMRSLAKFLQNRQEKQKDADVPHFHSCTPFVMDAHLWSNVKSFTAAQSRNQKPQTLKRNATKPQPKPGSKP